MGAIVTDAISAFNETIVIMFNGCYHVCRKSGERVMGIYLFRRIGQRWGIGTRLPFPHVGLYLALGIVLAVVANINWSAALGLAPLILLLFVILLLRSL